MRNLGTGPSMPRLEEDQTARDRHISELCAREPRKPSERESSSPHCLTRQTAASAVAQAWPTNKGTHDTTNSSVTVDWIAPLTTPPQARAPQERVSSDCCNPRATKRKAIFHSSTRSHGWYWGFVRPLVQATQAQARPASQSEGRRVGAVWNAIAGNDAFVPGTSGGDRDWGREPAVRRGGAIFGGRTSGQRESAGENGVRRLLSARAWPDPAVHECKFLCETTSRSACISCLGNCRYRSRRA